MFGQNLSHKLLKASLVLLVSSKLMAFEEDHGRRVFFSTANGRVALNCYRNAIALLNGHASMCPLTFGLPPAGALGRKPVSAE